MHWHFSTLLHSDAALAGSLEILHCTLYIVQLYNVHCTFYTVHCTLYIRLSTAAAMHWHFSTLSPSRKGGMHCCSVVFVVYLYCICITLVLYLYLCCISVVFILYLCCTCYVFVLYL